jgi:ABC-type bacteriocin/lantibiotic exporter with double-glycine peptidase domain
MLSVDRRDILYLYAYAVTNGLVNLSLPLGVQAIIGLILAGQISSSWVLLTALVTLGVLMAGGLQIVQLGITEILQQRIFTRAAFEFAYRIPRFKARALGRAYPPELINRFFDTLNLQKGLSKILMDFSASSLQIVFGLILLSFYHPFFIFFGILLIALLLLIFRFTGPRGLESSLKESTYKYRVAQWLKELARTMNTFKLAGETDLPLQKTDENVTQYLKHRKRHFRVLVFQYGNIVAFKALITLGLLMLGGMLVIQNEINVGQFVASEIVIILIMGSAEKLILTMEPIYDVLTAVEKMAQVTEVPLEEELGTVRLDAASSVGMSIEMRDVCFQGSDGRPVLDAVNLKIEPGDRVCIDGPGACGKSSLLSVIAGLEFPDRGTVLMDGLPMGNLQLPAMRTIMGDSLGQEDLFEGTLLENISLGREGVDLDAVRWAMERVGLGDWIGSLSRGLDTPISAGGSGLARTVVRRIILARSIAHKPRIVVLDDFLEAFGPEERALLLDACTGTDVPWTLVAVSHDREFRERATVHVEMQRGRVKVNRQAPSPFKSGI